MGSMWSVKTMFILDFVKIGECLKAETTHDVESFVFRKQSRPTLRTITAVQKAGEGVNLEKHEA